MEKICENMEKYKVKLEGLLEFGHKIGAKCSLDRIHTHTYTERKREVLLELYKSELTI